MGGVDASAGAGRSPVGTCHAQTAQATILVPRQHAATYWCQLGEASAYLCSKPLFFGNGLVAACWLLHL